jgi:hypothetical protein
MFGLDTTYLDLAEPCNSDLEEDASMNNELRPRMKKMETPCINLGPPDRNRVVPSILYRRAVLI